MTASEREEPETVGRVLALFMQHWFRGRNAERQREQEEDLPLDLGVAPVVLEEAGDVEADQDQHHGEVEVGPGTVEAALPPEAAPRARERDPDDHQVGRERRQPALGGADSAADAAPAALERARGVAAAQDSIARGVYILLVPSAMPVPWMHAIRLQEYARYGVEYHLTGDAFNPIFESYRAGFNETMSRVVRDRHGEDVFERIHGEIERRLRAEAPDTRPNG